MQTQVRQREQASYGPTSSLVSFAASVSWEELTAEVRHYSKRHLLDTIGVMIAGSTGRLATQAESVLCSVRPGGTVPVPGRIRRADILDAVFLSGLAGHGIELDDGYRQGSVHPGVCVVPAALYASYGRAIGGSKLLEGIVAGYEVMTALASITHPALRRRGFHPTSVLGVFGAAAAAGHLYELDSAQFTSAFGIAASASAGLFAFINGGADTKRLHAGHAAREGMQAVLLAAAGVSGPPDVIEGRDGMLQSFAFGEAQQPDIELPPRVAFRITDCYIKPYACCRHLQPAVEALIGLLNEEAISEQEIRGVRVETYAISAAHARTGWDDDASAQLSFPYIMALGMRHRSIRREHFADAIRSDAGLTALCQLVQVECAPDLDALYPKSRPARVTVSTDRGQFARSAMEARGCREAPLDDAALSEKFLDMTTAVLGRRAHALLEQLWNVHEVDDITHIIELVRRE